MKESILTDLQQEEAGRRAMQVGKKIITISFATLLTELPVSLREKRNANEILICCLGFYVTAFVPRYCSSSSVKGVRCEGRRKQGVREMRTCDPKGSAAGRLLDHQGGQDGESLPDSQSLGSASWRNSRRAEPFSSLFSSF